VTFSDSGSASVLEFEVQISIGAVLWAGPERLQTKTNMEQKTELQGIQKSNRSVRAL
jgi:hypothetical protein